MRAVLHIDNTGCDHATAHSGQKGVRTACRAAPPETKRSGATMTVTAIGVAPLGRTAAGAAAGT
jgi:hypothetical protein